MSFHGEHAWLLKPGLWQKPHPIRRKSQFSRDNLLRQLGRKKRCPPHMRRSPFTLTQLCIRLHAVQVPDFIEILNHSRTAQIDCELAACRSKDYKKIYSIVIIDRDWKGLNLYVRVSACVCVSVSMRVCSIVLFQLLVPTLSWQRQTLFTGFSVTTGLVCCWEHKGHWGE